MIMTGYDSRLDEDGASAELVAMRFDNKCVFTIPFFFQAEDGIRVRNVTGVQTCALPISGRHAAYLSAAAVRTRGSVLTATDRTEIVPTYIFGYEYSISQKTNIVAQYYVSPSVFTHEDTDLPGLLKTKYQISIGLRHRVEASVWTFAITENMRNFDNTPDIGSPLPRPS